MAWNMVLIALRIAARHSGLTKRLEEMGFLGRDWLRETRMLTSEKLHEGARQLGTNNDQNTVDSADNLKSANPSWMQCRTSPSSYGLHSMYLQSHMYRSLSVLSCYGPRAVWCVSLLDDARMPAGERHPTIPLHKVQKHTIPKHTIPARHTLRSSPHASCSHKKLQCLVSLPGGGYHWNRTLCVLQEPP